MQRYVHSEIIQHYFNLNKIDGFIFRPAFTAIYRTALPVPHLQVNPPLLVAEQTPPLRHGDRKHGSANSQIFPINPLSHAHVNLEHIIYERSWVLCDSNAATLAPQQFQYIDHSPNTHFLRKTAFLLNGRRQDFKKATFQRKGLHDCVTTRNYKDAPRHRH